MRLLLALLLATAALAATASPAGAYVYWTYQDTPWIGRANLDGSGVEPQFVPTRSGDGGVATGDGHVFWTNRADGTIGRADVTGGDVDQAFLTTAEPSPDAISIAVDAGTVFWTWSTGAIPTITSGIGRASTDGNGAEVDTLPTSDGFDSPAGVAAAGPYLFWAMRPYAGCCPAVYRSLRDGSAPSLLLGGGGKGWWYPTQLATDDQHLYFDSYLSIGRADFDGGDRSFFGDPAQPPLLEYTGPIAVDQDHLYWTNSDGTISRSETDGRAVEPTWIPVAGDHPYAIAVDDAGPVALGFLRLRHRRVRRSVRVAYRTDKTQTVTFRLSRRGHRLRGERVRRPTVAGTDRFRLRARWHGRRLRPGRYRLTATPSVDGGTAPSATTRFRVLRQRREPRHKGGAPVKRSG